MGYHVIDPNEIELEPDRPSDMHNIGKKANLNNFGLKLYNIAPGEQIPLFGLHYHDQQEEAFFVTRGELSVETPNKEYVVEEGNFFIAEPNSPHRAFNDQNSSEDVTVVAIGSPKVDDGHEYS